jgi:hypothetical protein
MATNHEITANLDTTSIDPAAVVDVRDTDP